jgi:mannose-6-phosphate isomerase-like protein (cupin superfamily)
MTQDAERLIELAQSRWPGFEKWAVGGDIIIVLADAQTSPDGATWTECIEPASDGTLLPLHHHPEQTQFIRIVRGRLRVIYGDEDVVIRSGNSLLIAAGMPHRAWNPGPGVTIAHTAFLPGGNEAVYRSHGVRLENMDAAKLHAQKNADANEQLVLSMEQLGLLAQCDSDSNFHG